MCDLALRNMKIEDKNATLYFSKTIINKYNFDAEPKQEEMKETSGLEKRLSAFISLFLFISIFRFSDETLVLHEGLKPSAHCHIKLCTSTFSKKKKKILIQKIVKNYSKIQ